MILLLLNHFSGIQISQKKKALVDSGVQCNIGNLPVLTLLPTDLANHENTKDNATENKEPVSVEEPFEDLDVDDADYNPSIESGEDDDEKELAKSERY